VIAGVAVLKSRKEMRVRKRLVNRAEPNLFADIFDYNSVPKILFDQKIYEEIDGKLVSFDPKEATGRELIISDTTFRDGQQARPPYTVEQIVRLFEMMSRLSGPRGVVRYTEFFLYSRKDREAVEGCRELGLRYPEITGWMRAEPGDFRLVREMGLGETGILTSCSDYHIYYKLRKDRRKAFDDYIRIVEAAIEAGVRVRCHLEDVTRADIEGFVLPFVQKLTEISEQVPDELKVKVRLCDTMGFGITYPGAALPRSIPKLIYKVSNEGGVPPERLEWHGHNDFHKVHINAAAAWLYGCNILNASLLGFGERTGNPPLEGAVIEYIGLMGDMAGMDTRVITEIAEYYRKEVGASVPANYPFVGSAFNVTRAGIHAGGLERDERVYNIFDTARLLGRPVRVAITDKSGIDGVVKWVNDFLGLEGEERLGKLDVVRIGRWVVDQYERENRVTAISEEELVEQIRRHLPDYYERYVAERGDG